MRSSSYRAAAGRIGGLVTASRVDTRANTALARQTFFDSFEAQVDPDGVLDPVERTRRATAARKAHYARLAMRSAEVRRKKRGAA